MLGNYRVVIASSGHTIMRDSPVDGGESLTGLGGAVCLQTNHHQLFHYTSLAAYLRNARNQTLATGDSVFASYWLVLVGC
jgi:hypothetical protein